MASTHHQLSLPPVPVESLDRDRETSVPPAVNEVSPTAILIGAVEDERGWQEKDAAYSQGYTPSYWSQIKGGGKAAQVERIARLPVKVQKRFVRRYARALGMEVSEETAAARQKRAFAELQCALANAMKAVI